MRPRSFLFLGCFAWFALLVPACGRPATQQDCDDIVSRITELELKEAPSSDPSDVAKEVAETKETFRAKEKRECVGKRITDGALRCVRNAKTAEEIVRECLN